MSTIRLLVASGLLIGLSQADDSVLEVEVLQSASDASFRGIAVIDNMTVIACGSNSTVVGTHDCGTTWNRLDVENSTSLDFRDIEALSGNTLVLMAAGPGGKSCICRSADGGKSWSTVFRNTIEGAFFNGMAFWPNGDGLVVGDPIENKLDLLQTQDCGQTWRRINGLGTRPGEYGFAASGTGIVTSGDRHVWIATGAATARVFQSIDRGLSWNAVGTPIRHGTKSSGIFSVSFYGSKNGIVVGGDYLKPKLGSNNCAVTNDGGLKWAAPDVQMPHKACVRFLDAKRILAVGRTGIMLSTDRGNLWTTISTDSWYTFDVDESSKTVFLAGPNGRLARMKLQR